MTHVSYSQITSYRECPKKFYYAYVERLKRNKQDVSPMASGLLFHDLMAAGISAYIQTDYRLSYVELLDVLNSVALFWLEENPLRAPKVENEFGYEVDSLDFIEEYTTMIDDAITIAYRTFLEMDFKHNWRVVLDKHGTPMVEYDFEAEFGASALRGRVDLVARNTQNNLVYLVDWKTKGSLDSTIANDLTYITQMSLYQKALRQFTDIHAVLVAQVLFAAPREPELNKNGTMSRAYIKTDWETYKQALVENGLDPDEYLDMKEKLSDIRWFNFIELFHSSKELNAVWSNMLAWSQRAENDTDYLMNIGPLCRFCPFMLLCRAQLDGDDIDLTKMYHYIVKDLE